MKTHRDIILITILTILSIILVFSIDINFFVFDVARLFSVFVDINDISLVLLTLSILVALFNFIWGIKIRENNVSKTKDWLLLILTGLNGTLIFVFCFLFYGYLFF